MKVKELSAVALALVALNTLALPSTVSAIATHRSIDPAQAIPSPG